MFHQDKQLKTLRACITFNDRHTNMTQGQTRLTSTDRKVSLQQPNEASA